MNSNNEITWAQPGPAKQPAILVKAARRMAQAYVKLFGPFFRTTVLAEMVIQAGVEEAAERCRQQEPDTKPTLSKLIMMTGVSYNKVKSILEQTKGIISQHICTESAVLAYWYKVHRDPATGAPLDLPIFGYADSFQGVAQRVGGRGVSAQTLLDRLIASGNLQTVNKHFVRIIDPNWRILTDNEDEILDSGTRSLASLATAVTHNLAHRSDDAAKWVERRVYSRNIPEQEFEQTRKETNAFVKKQHEELARFIRSKESKTNNESCRVLGVGYYLWES